MLKAAMIKNGMEIKGRKIRISKSNENSTIFIGNIRKNWTEKEVDTKIRRIFQNVVKIEYFKDNVNSTKNRGFCFAIFNSRNEAIKALNYVQNKGGIKVDGIPLTCDWADVIEEDNINSNQVFISGIKEDVDEDNLKIFFSKFGNIDNIVLSKNHPNPKRKDLAFITFKTHDEACKAIKGIEDLMDNQNELKKIQLELQQVFHLNIDEFKKLKVSLAFTQQSMQNKKKLKDSRKKLNKSSVQNNNVTSVNSNINSNVQTQNNSFLNQNMNNDLSNKNISASTLLAVMDLLSKSDPNTVNQLLNVCGLLQNQIKSNDNQNDIKDCQNTNFMLLNKKRNLTTDNPSFVNNDFQNRTIANFTNDSNIHHFNENP